MTAFAAHGTLEINIEDPLVLINARGPWNIEYLDDLHQQLINAIAQVDKNNYALLISLKGEAVIVNAGLEYHLSFIRQGKPRAIAVNLAQCRTVSLTKSIFNKMYRSANIKHQFFESALDARQWLEQQA